MIRHANYRVNLHHVPPLNARLSAPALDALSEIARTIYLGPQDILLGQCETIHAFYVIVEGGVRLVEYTPDGQSVALKIYGPGDLFGLLAVSGSYPHPAQIEAIHDSVLVAFDGQDARRLMSAYPEVALMVIDLLTEHVHHAHQRIRHMAAEKVDRRLARTLLHLCDKFGRADGRKISIDAPLSQRDLAEFTGTTVETINRTLTAWEKQGVVSCSHRHIDVLDRAALNGIAENIPLPVQI
ncbi:MAG: Crp/Fnr family transcriptional regulator [Chloroflexi bacterium]|nr:Crp/Fnr family transcriptional regulator [Chloroflexota bacterium]